MRRFITTGFATRKKQIRTHRQGHPQHSWLIHQNLELVPKARDGAAADNGMAAAPRSVTTTKLLSMHAATSEYLNSLAEEEIPIDRRDRIRLLTAALATQVGLGPFRIHRVIEVNTPLIER
jgi:hypothetical protein